MGRPTRRRTTAVAGDGMNLTRTPALVAHYFHERHVTYAAVVHRLRRRTPLLTTIY
jgi:hypothetical protein